MSTGMWIGAVVALLVYGVLHHYYEDLRPTLHVVGVGAVAVAGIGQWVTSNEQLQRSADRTTQQVDHRRVATAFDFIEAWERPNMRRASSNALIAADSIRGRPAKDVQTWLDDHPQYKAALVRTLNMFDKWGLAVREGYADEGALCRWMGSKITNLHNATWQWIDYKREDEGDHALWREFEFLAETWPERCPANE